MDVRTSSVIFRSSRLCAAAETDDRTMHAADMPVTNVLIGLLRLVSTGSFCSLSLCDLSATVKHHRRPVASPWIRIPHETPALGFRAPTPSQSAGVRVKQRLLSERNDLSKELLMCSGVEVGGWRESSPHSVNKRQR